MLNCAVVYLLNKSHADAKPTTLVIMLTMLLSATTSSYGMSDMTGEKYGISDMTVEYLSNPLGVDVSPRFSWKVVPITSGARGIFVKQSAITVSHAINQSVLWTATPTSNATHLVPYTGPTLVSDARYSWKIASTLSDGTVVSSAVGSFGTALLDSADWRATWITGNNSARLLRTEFSLASAGYSYATLFIAGIGYHEVQLNGMKVSDAMLEAGWSSFDKRVYYTAHDVGPLLRAGPNALGVSLGNGWWSCGPAPGSGQPRCSSSPPQLLVQLQVHGVPVVISSPATWKVHAGPITYDSLYNGEHYDARIAAALEDWSTTGFDDSAWVAATAAASSANDATLASRLFEPVRHLATFTPRWERSARPGAQTFDFGQNMAGVVRLSGLRCAAGTVVTLRHAELLMHPPCSPQCLEPWPSAAERIAGRISGYSPHVSFGPLLPRWRV
jgi:alpha-L-rhamnosidase